MRTGSHLSSHHNIAVSFPQKTQVVYVCLTVHHGASDTFLSPKHQAPDYGGWRGEGETRSACFGREEVVEDKERLGVRGVRPESADSEGAEGEGEKVDRQGQRTSDSMPETEGQRSAYSYQCFKHIPLSIQRHYNLSTRTLLQI